VSALLNEGGRGSSGRSKKGLEICGTTAKTRKVWVMVYFLKKKRVTPESVLLSFSFSFVGGIFMWSVFFCSCLFLSIFVFSFFEDFSKKGSEGKGGTSLLFLKKILKIINGSLFLI